MKFNISTPFLTVDGKPQTFPDNGGLATMGAVMLMAVIGNYKEDAGLTGEQKLARYRLKQKLARVLEKEDGEIDLSDQEKITIKKCASAGLSIDAYGQIFDFLDTPPPSLSSVEKV